jgi:hypothetical protein
MSRIEKFLPSDNDTWHWRLADLTDVDDIVAMAQTHFQSEVQQVFVPDPALYAKHVSLAVVEQSFDFLKCQLIVARDKVTNQLKSYAWLNRGHFMVYAREECAEAAFAHMDMTLPARERIVLMAQILMQWEMWCKITQIPVLVSTTIRSDQKGFLRLHEEAGFEIRGSFAFKKIELL